jgi:cytochrome P450
VHAEVDGERLTSVEIASFFILLSAAGNETTRNAISHGMVALTRYPEERDKWWCDFDGVAATAVEEIVRWASPVIFMQRNLTQDIEMSGIKMKAGARVSMWYYSGNCDEAKFDNPWLFDVTRDPNPHIGFGSGGAHFRPQRGVVTVTRVDDRRVAVDVEHPARDVAEKLLEVALLPCLANPAGEERRS